MFKNFNLTFKNEDEARQILELIRYANVHKQKPLVKEEFIFIAKYPKIAELLLTMSPPKITIFQPLIIKDENGSDELEKELKH